MTREEAIEYLQKLYLMADITDEYGDMADTEPYETAIDMAIEALQTEPVKYGEWKYYNYSDVSNPYQGYFICSVCEEYEHAKHNFCPNCGAKMDKE